MVFYDRGLGISRNILECYRFLFDHFQAGDCVFLFGWHGASTRSGTSGAAPAAPPPSWPASSTCGRRSRSSARSHAFRHRFHNTRLSDSVEFGCHALAIDDERLTFHPTLWDEPDLRVEQVWFPGMHSDPGGGYAEAHLSDIALQWIARHAMARGLLLYERHLVTGRS